MLQAIQTQVDYINTIRSELGILIPETVTTSELRKLNKPVVDELRARRNTLTEDSQEKPQTPFLPNQCPDISGIYYDRAINSYGEYRPNEENSSDYITTNDNLDLCKLSGWEYKDYMPLACSLRYWFDRSLIKTVYVRGTVYGGKGKGITYSHFPAKIEFVTKENFKTLDVILYKWNRIDKKFTIDLESSGVRCEGGSMILIEERYDAWINSKASRPTLFLSEDGSLNIDLTLPLPFWTPFGALPLHMDPDYPWLPFKQRYIWGRVDSGVNPYKDSH